MYLAWDSLDFEIAKNLKTGQHICEGMVEIREFRPGKIPKLGIGKNPQILLY